MHGAVAFENAVVLGGDQQCWMPNGGKSRGIVPARTGDEVGALNFPWILVAHVHRASIVR
jgi:hypothetical protein